MANPRRLFGEQLRRAHGERLRADLAYEPGMDCDSMREAIRGRVSPFRDDPGEPPEESSIAMPAEVLELPRRVDWLTRRLFGIPGSSGDAANLRYRLLTAVAGTMFEAQAHRATTAILLIRELRTPLTSDEKLLADAEALNRFLRLFHSCNGGLDEPVHLEPGEMAGPVSLVERDLAQWNAEIPIFIGKVSTVVRIS